MHDNDKCADSIHMLWLIYCQLKDAEDDPASREELVSSARARLGDAVKDLNHLRIEPKSPCTQADN